MRIRPGIGSSSSFIRTACLFCPRFRPAALKGAFPGRRDGYPPKKSIGPLRQGPRRDFGGRNDRARYQRPFALPGAGRSGAVGSGDGDYRAGLTARNPGFISLVCILEIVWVLGSLYKRTRGQIAQHIEMILAADTLEVQNEQEVYQAVVALAMERDLLKMR